MTFLQFLGDHPWISFFFALVITNTIIEITKIIIERKQ